MTSLYCYVLDPTHHKPVCSTSCHDLTALALPSPVSVTLTMTVTMIKFMQSSSYYRAAVHVRCCTGRLVTDGGNILYATHHNCFTLKPKFHLARHVTPRHAQHCRVVTCVSGSYPDLPIANYCHFPS